MQLAPGRAAFFGAGPVWPLWLLAAAALALFIWGLARRQDLATPPGRSWPAHWLLLAPLWRASPLCGLLTALAWWTLMDLAGGCLLWLAHLGLYPFLRGRAYLFFSWYLDWAGAVFTVACLLLLIGRYTLWRRRPLGVRNRWLLWLGLFSGFTGFVVEAGRLGATRPDWAWWSPVGMRLAERWLGGASDAALWAWWWVHALLGLALFAGLPWLRVRAGDERP
ncbi:MAG: hypothetical protein C4525_04680 [Desulfarculus sp.]|nr:MAG: hypothetical protein C4525_04680 [Desulfarculus sp.]